MDTTAIIVVTSIATAISTQLAFVCYELIRGWNKRRSTRKLILSDIRRLDGLLENIHDAFAKLANDLHSSSIPPVPMHHWPSFTVDVYKSVPLSDIHEAFGQNTLLLVELYKFLEYRESHTPKHRHESIVKEMSGLKEGMMRIRINCKNECLNDRDNTANLRGNIAIFLKLY